mgnify:CR=1 FL=1
MNFGHGLVHLHVVDRAFQAFDLGACGLHGDIATASITVNSIPMSATFELDMRSEDPAILADLERELGIPVWSSIRATARQATLAAETV